MCFFREDEISLIKKPWNAEFYRTFTGRTILEEAAATGTVFEQPAQVWRRVVELKKKMAMVTREEKEVKILLEKEKKIGKLQFYLTSTFFQGKRYTSVRKIKSHEEEGFIMYDSGPNLSEEEFWKLLRNWGVIEERLTVCGQNKPCPYCQKTYFGEKSSFLEPGEKCPFDCGK